MKNEIIVTTDFSVNSKAGIRFAIQYASQCGTRLVFLNIVEPLIPTRWNDAQVKMHMDEEIKARKKALRKFVQDVYGQCHVSPGKFECVVRYALQVDREIVNYAMERRAGSICMSTRGAGIIRRLVGTHTSSVISNSPVPVFAIPRNYKRVVIENLMYASDLTHIRNELNKVKRFADAITARINVVHYESPTEVKAKGRFSKVALRYRSSRLDFHLERYDLEKSFAYHLKKAIRKFRPSIIVLFTNQDRDWYERLFIGSKSADVSYGTRTPLMVFPKRKHSLKLREATGAQASLA